MNLYDKIRNVPDFPIKGIQFKDITTLLQDAKAYKEAIDQIAKHYKKMKIDKIVSQEARGFIFGGTLAYILGAGFVPIRKPGKLPYKTVSYTYEKEYGKDEIHMHEDAIEKGEKVLLFDDLLATGGTGLAGAKLIEKLGGEVIEQGFLIELTGSLHGREFLEKEGYKVWSLLQIEVEE
ncbi:MAG: adenine phosphoribosyltransferase [Candidatus Helarchaeales archaeon]